MVVTEELLKKIRKGLEEGLSLTEARKSAGIRYTDAVTIARLNKNKTYKEMQRIYNLYVQKKKSSTAYSSFLDAWNATKLDGTTEVATLLQPVKCS